jgi:type VI secretion system FHA domain protein
MLVLTLRNCDYLADGGSVRIELDRRGAVLGRSSTVDWTLPDPSNIISSRHCEIYYEGGRYVAVDVSTNGTFVNGSRLTDRHPIASGDVLSIGHYEVMASLSGAMIGGDAGYGGAAPWGGWESHMSAAPVGISPSDWDRSTPKAAISGQGPLSGNMIPPRAPSELINWGQPQTASPEEWSNEPASSDAGSPWAAMDLELSSTPNSASDWSSPAGREPAPPSAEDIWGRLAESNAVDWARGGFGVMRPTLAAAESLGVAKAAADFSPLPAAAAPTAIGTPEPSMAGASLDAQFAEAMGVDPTALRQDGKATLTAMGRLLRSLVSGLVVMLEARARAKAQMGAQATSLEFDGNNPLKFARTPEQALAQLINPTERGFMSADDAVQDAFVDLQTHQVATLKAMQGALRATLDRFSPEAIQARGQTKGILAQILPGAQDAALWRAYVKEFSGVAQKSDEAFMDVFAKEFRKAYMDEATKRRQDVNRFS